jgi:glycosyltransferase involved in cell wall biosynthesis
MNSSLLQANSPRPSPRSGLDAERAVSVAVICDYLEEQWPSMDLNGDLLSQFLVQQRATDLNPIQVRPDFHQRMMRLPFLPAQLTWNVDRVLNRFVDYPRWLRRRIRNFGLFHVVDHSYSQLIHSLPAKRTVVTCHDLDTFRSLLEPGQGRRSLWFQAMTRRILHGFLQAAHVICNSRATRSQLLHYRLFPEERITVIHSAVHPDFTSSPDAASDAEARRLLGPAWSGEIRLLSVASTIPRKRMDVLLRIFAAVRNEFPAARLLRVGGPFTEAQRQLARQLGVEPYVAELPFLTREVLAAVYRQATLLLQPSESEGFGLPIAEALACGCPVIASDLEALREVGGSVCEYCPVGDVDAWKHAVAQELRQVSQPDGGYAPSRRQRAVLHASQYSGTENARQTIEVYRRVLEQATL